MAGALVAALAISFVSTNAAAIAPFDRASELKQLVESDSDSAEDILVPDSDDRITSTGGSAMSRAASELDSFDSESIAAALASSGAEGVNVSPDAAEMADLEPEPDMMAASLPGNLFNVSTSWADWYEGGSQHIALYGRWNYRDDVVGSGNPLDAAGLVARGFKKKCFQTVDSGIITQSSDGSHTDLGWIRNAKRQQTVFEVQDRTSNHRLLTDMGFTWIVFKRKPGSSGCGSDMRGKFFHEHNQGGKKGTWSFTLTLSGLTINYSAGDPTLRLQKSTPLAYYS